jgi:hypothetical protein
MERWEPGDRFLLLSDKQLQRCKASALYKYRVIRLAQSSRSIPSGSPDDVYNCLQWLDTSFDPFVFEWEKEDFTKSIESACWVFFIHMLRKRLIGLPVRMLPERRVWLRPMQCFTLWMGLSLLMWSTPPLAESSGPDDGSRHLSGRSWAS